MLNTKKIFLVICLLMLLISNSYAGNLKEYPVDLDEDSLVEEEVEIKVRRTYENPSSEKENLKERKIESDKDEFEDELAETEFKDMLRAFRERSQYLDNPN